MDRLRAAGMRFGTRLGLTSAMISRPTSLLQLCPGADGVLLVGEAAGFISPSSAEGISYALQERRCARQGPRAGPWAVRTRDTDRPSWPLALDVGVKAVKSSAIYGAGDTAAHHAQWTGLDSGAAARTGGADDPVLPARGRGRRASAARAT